MENINPEILNWSYGGFLLVAMYGGFRLVKMLLERYLAASTFTETLAKSTLVTLKEANQNAMAVQEQTVATMAALEAELRHHGEQAEGGTEKILEGQQQIIDRLGKLSTYSERG